MKLTNQTVFLGLGFLVFVVAAVVTLIITGQETQGLVTLLVTLIFPTFISLMGLQRSQETLTKTHDTQQQLGLVQAQTNGIVHQLTSTVARQSDLLAVADPLLPAELDQVHGRHGTP